MILEIREKSGKKFDLWRNGERYGRCYPGDLRELGFVNVAEGQELEVSEPVFSAFEQNVLLPRAKRRTLFLLGKKEYTRQEMKKKLVLDGYPDSTVSAVLDYLEELHYVDDFSYAERYAFSLLSRCSERELLQKMLQKGLDKEVSKTALDAAKERYCFEQSGKEDMCSPELAAIQSFLRKKGYCAEKATDEKKKKMMAALFRKGFSMSDIRTVIGELNEECGF